MGNAISRWESRGNILISNEDGSMTIMGLFIFLMMAVVGAIGLDVANLMSARNQLQISADAAAHAALYQRNSSDAASAKNKAIEIAALNMPAGKYGTVLTAADIEFGVFDYDSYTFTADPSANSAVRVNTKRLVSRSNSVGSLLFQFVGFWEWDIVTPAIYATYKLNCTGQGVYARHVARFRSNNTFKNGFEICAGDHAAFSSNNVLEPGTTVFMPDTGDLVIPASGFATNTGLQDSLRSGHFQPLILNDLPDIISGLAVGDPAYTPAYITSTVPLALPGKNVDETDFIAGRIHTYYCTGGAALQIKMVADAMKEVVLITDCKVNFVGGPRLEDVIIATTNTDARSIHASSDLTIGKDDSCATGGGAQVLSHGGVNVAAKLNLYGGQVVALGDISFSANADGVEGASIISGGDVDGTSNATLAYCGDGSGMEGNFEADYFRLAG